MRKNYASLLARCVAVGLFLVSASAGASVIFTADPSPPLSAFIIPQFGFGGVCFTDPSGQQTCFDGPWVDAKLPDLGVPGTVAFDTQNLFFGGHLVNAQQGTFSVSLTPSFDWVDANPSRDELQVSLANNQSILAVSQHGRLEFTANPGTQYFLLLDGTVRGGTAYSLSISPVPEPASGALIAAGLALVAYRTRQRSRHQGNTETG